VKRALIFGVTGQDGSYLAEHLLEQNYEVHGFYRRSATGNTEFIDHIKNDLVLHRGDLADVTSLYTAINSSKPHEVYNEADQDHVDWSYHSVGYSCDITGKAVGDILEVIKQVDKSIKYIQPVSSHMFGNVETSPQDISTPFRPQSPYAAAKVLAFTLVRYFRDIHGIHASNAIMYNHTSIKKNDDYAINKIVNSALRIKHGLQEKLELGGIDVEVDYGYAPEYVAALNRLVQLEQPGDYILASGKTITLRRILEIAFGDLGLNFEDYVTYNKSFERPGKMGVLRGDISATKAAIDYDLEWVGEKLVRKLMEEARQKILP
jgi:GDPmannose 4,6-dehydratase